MKNKNVSIQCENNYKWERIKDIETLMKIGVHMENALTLESFSKMYSEAMILFFLKNELDEVVINVSFFKKDDTMGMIAGYRNAPPKEEMKPYIEYLFEKIGVPEELNKVKYKD